MVAPTERVQGDRPEKQAFDCVVAKIAPIEVHSEMVGAVGWQRSSLADFECELSWLPRRSCGG